MLGLHIGLTYLTLL